MAEVTWSFAGSTKFVFRLESAVAEFVLSTSHLVRGKIVVVVVAVGGVGTSVFS